MRHLDPQTLEAQDHRFVWHPFTPMGDWLQDDPLVIERGEGVFLWDIHGRRYYDGNASLWVNIHGHRHPRIDAAIRAQLELISHSTMLGLSNPLAIQLAGELVSIAPPGLARVFYSDSGSEAVEIALKMAFQHWKLKGDNLRTRYLTLENGYHGDTLGAVSVGGMDRFHSLYRPLLFPTHQAPSPAASPRDAGWLLREFRSLLWEHREELAAVILEPLIQAAGGMVLMPPGFLHGVAAACREAGVLLIVDEVATGFGRTGKMFACEHEDVRPDLMTVAKGITGGYLPLAATLTTEAVFDPFRRPGADAVFYHGHSYTGNAMACAAALANLAVFREERTLERLGPKIELLRRRLGSVARLPHVQEIRQFGMMVGIELVEDRENRVPYPEDWRMGARVCQRARELGMITRPLGDVVVLLPPLGAVEEDLSAMLQILEQSIKDVTSDRAATTRPPASDFEDAKPGQER